MKCWFFVFSLPLPVLIVWAFSHGDILPVVSTNVSGTSIRVVFIRRLASREHDSPTDKIK